MHKDPDYQFCSFPWLENAPSKHPNIASSTSVWMHQGKAYKEDVDYDLWYQEYQESDGLCEHSSEPTKPQTCDMDICMSACM